MIRTAIKWLCPLLLLSGLSHNTALALDPNRPLDQYGHQVWQTDSGLPQNTIHTILQTRDGYLWLGTEGGLVRFDSIDFTTFDAENTPQLKSDSIHDLLEDHEGALWIATATGLVRYQDGSFRTYTTEQGLPADAVFFTYEDSVHRLWAITRAGPAFFDGSGFHPIASAQAATPESRRGLAEDANGILWLASGAGLFAVNTRAAAPRLDRHLLEGVEAEAVMVDSQGDLWIGTSQGFERYSHSVLTAIPLAGIPAKTAVTSLLADGSGGVWVGTAAGLAHWVNGNTTIFGTRDGLPAARVDSLFADRERALWIATDRGAARLLHNRIESFPASSRLSSENVLAIFEDREGDLWLGTDSGGLNMLREQKFITYGTTDGLSADLVLCVLQNSRGDIWIGTSGGGLDHRTGQGFASLTTRDGLSSNVILSLASSPDGDLWIGTPDGLNRLHQGHIHKYSSSDGLPDDFIRSLYTDHDGSLWIGTRHGLAHFTDGNFTTYSSLDGLGSDFIGAILRAGNGGGEGDLWIGTSGGLTRLRNGRFTNYTVKNGLSNTVVTAIHQDAQGDIWLATNGGGLNRLRNGSIHSFPYGSKALPATIYGILEDSGNHLWLSARTGIFRLPKDTLNAFADGTAQAIPMSAYGTADGMKIRECSSGGHPAAWKMSDGTLWFATLEGVSLIDPDHMPENRLPPPVVIEKFLVNDQLRNAAQDLRIKPGANRLEFLYAGLSFVAPQKVKYRYRLEGFDHGWIDAGTRRAAFYTNLPPGNYRFRIMAANNDGVWNEAGASLAFRMEPHFYQTLWFYSVAALAALLLAYLIYRWYSHRVKREFSAVLAERGRLAREIHDTLAQGYVGISVQLELVSRLLTTSQEAARHQLDQARALVRAGLEEARSSIWQLRSQGTALEDLPARLTKVCTGTNHPSSTKVSVQVKGTYHPLDREIENELLRIGQEAVVNAVRHADATRVDVQLIYDGSRVSLNVQDNGRGFSGTANTLGKEGHFGIQGMRERAEQIDAALSLESTPGQGTRVCVEFPWRNYESAELP